MTRAQVSAWRNTSAQKNAQGAIFGLRLGIPLRDTWVTAGAREVQLELEGGPTLTIELRAAFWNKCPEFKHAEIGDWLRSLSIALPWPKCHPPTFDIEKLSGSRFRVFRRAHSI